MLGTVYLLIGKVCSGKTTYAGYLSEEHKAVILSCDKLLLTLHSGNTAFDFDAEISNVKKYLFNLTVTLINIGVNVVLDWGFWDVKERDEINTFLLEKGIPHEWHYMMPDEDIWQKRICSRNAETRTEEFYVDSGLLNKCNENFNVPSVTELKEKKVIIHDQ